MWVLSALTSPLQSVEVPWYYTMDHTTTSELEKFNEKAEESVEDEHLPFKRQVCNILICSF